MKARIAFVLLALAVPALAFDMSGVLSWSIPEGEVARVEVAGEVVWPSIPYSTNGLVAYWDGVWNAGVGIHDSTATVWKDLSGHGYDGVQQHATGWHWASDAYVADIQSWSGFALPLTLTPEINQAYRHLTVEAVALSNESPTNTWATLFGNFGGSIYGNGYCFDIDGRSQVGYGRLNSYYFNSPYFMPSTYPVLVGVRHTYTATSSSSRTAVYYDGLFSNRGNVAGRDSGTNRYYLARTGNPASGLTEKNFVGEICAVRVYNRVLSDAEIAYNAAIDAVRFGIGSEAPSAEMLSASSPRTLSALPRLELAESAILTPVHPAPTPY